MLAVPPSEELDIVGPWDVFATANNAVRGRKRGYNLELVTTGDRRSFQCNSGLTLSAKYRYKEVQGGVDTLIVTGGAGALTSHNRSVLDWIRKIARKTRRMCCNFQGGWLVT